MQKRQSDDHEVIRSLVLVLQVGISMLVPIAICFSAGYLIDRHFGTKWIFAFIVLGILSAYRATYLLIKSHIKRTDDDEPEEWVKKAFNKDDEDQEG